MEEKKGIFRWQKFVRGFWITIGSIFFFFLFGLFTLISSGPSDEEDLTDNQQYVITVSHGANTYTYYCSGYSRNPENHSYILIDYKGKPFYEIFNTPEIYMRASLNPKYKKEYFQKKEVKTNPDKSI